MLREIRNGIILPKERACLLHLCDVLARVLTSVEILKVSYLALHLQLGEFVLQLQVNLLERLGGHITVSHTVH